MQEFPHETMKETVDFEEQGGRFQDNIETTLEELKW